MIAAIDPGSTGAVAFFSDNGFLISVHDMPSIEVKVGKSIRHRVSPPGFIKMIRERDVSHVFIEKVGAMPGQSGMFAFGQAVGVVEGVLAALGVATTYVTPAAWKRFTGCGKDKSLSIQRATQLFPGAAHNWARKKDVDRAEAVLIGFYGAKLGLTGDAA